MKIKIVAKGYEGFCGLFGQVEFENAVSVDHVSKMEASRLGSIIEIVEVSEDGETVQMVGVGQDDVNNRNLSAQKIESVKTVEEAPVEEASVEEAPVEEAPVEEAPVEEAKKYTEAELEVIADEKGITGLRSIGEELNVKAPSISQLIAKILAAQGK